MDHSPVAPPQPIDTETAQYSLTKILAIWAAVTAPMALLAFVVAPALFDRTSMNDGLVFWMLMVVGMAWQFVLSLLILRRELGGLRWEAVKRRIWLYRPVDPKTGRRGGRLWWWVIPAYLVNVLGEYLKVDILWSALTGLHEPDHAKIQTLADPQFQGQWWILGLALTSCAFNYVLGEELLFRGVLLPKMAGVFGRWDWVANAVLFGLYHVHKIWFWPSMITTSFGISWAARRFRSFWMGVLVHGIESFFVVIVLAVILGWYP